MACDKNKIIDIIAQQSPMGIDAYMALVLGHPTLGYYTTKDPLGAKGDFTTAPEISQMFGEMIAAFLSDAWMQMGRQKSLHLIEFGPGRGTLMADILRTAKSWPDFYQALDIHFVETSPVLRQRAQEKLKPFIEDGREISWHENFDQVPQGFSFVVGNEFLDALPIRQYVVKNGVWHERKVVAEEKTLKFVLDPSDFDAPIAAEGSVLEICSAAHQLIEKISERLGRNGGLALFIDYGHSGGYGDTLQALRNHAFIDVLAHPGESDLTAHVDFAAIKKTAQNCGMRVEGPMSQRFFLQGIGIEARASKLLEKANPDQAKDILAGLERLIDPKEMGNLFQAIVITP